MYSYYLEGDLKNKINYSFSPFEGPNLFLYYYENRNEALINIRKHVNENKNKVKNSEFLDDLGMTEANLTHILNKIKVEKIISKDLDFFVRKFEINKILYDSYNEEAGQGAYTNIKNYILLSYCCLEAYAINSSLKLFNASLKLNDIIVSFIENIYNIEDLEQTIELLNLELSMVKRLIYENHD